MRPVGCGETAVLSEHAVSEVATSARTVTMLPMVMRFVTRCPLWVWSNVRRMSCAD